MSEATSDVPTTAKRIETFRGSLTAFLGNYDLGKLGNPSLKTEDIADDLLSTPEMNAIRTALLYLRDEAQADVTHYSWWLTLPPTVRKWVEG